MSTRRPLLDIVAFGLVPLPSNVQLVIVADEPGWSSSPDPTCTWSKWLLSAVSTPPWPTSTPSPEVPLVEIFETVTVDPTIASPATPFVVSRKETLLIVTLLDALTSSAPALVAPGAAMTLDPFAAPMIVRLLLPLMTTFCVYGPGRRMIVDPGLARLIARVKLPSGWAAVLPAVAPVLPVGAT